VKLCERVEKRVREKSCLFEIDLTRIFGLAFFTLSTEFLRSENKMVFVRLKISWKIQNLKSENL